MIETNKFDSFYESMLIGFPMTPSKWLTKKPNVIPVTRIQMQNQTLLVQKLDFSKLPDTFCLFPVKTWDGKDIVINTQYIQSMENCSIAEVFYHTENPNIGAGDRVERFLFREENVRPELSNEFHSDAETRYKAMQNATKYNG